MSFGLAFVQRCCMVLLVPDPKDRSSSEAGLAVPSAQIVVRMVAGVYRIFRVCPICSALFAERKVAEGRFTDINYSRHFVGQHKEGQMGSKTDFATLSPEEKAAARSEASRKAAETRRVQAAEKLAQNEQDGVGHGVSPSEAAKADKAAQAEAAKAEKAAESESTTEPTVDAPAEPSEEASAESSSNGNGEQRQRRTRTRREDSAVSQAITLLKELGRPASAKELFEMGVERGLMQGLKGKTPVATLSAQLYGAEQRGDVVKPERGKFAAA